MNPTVEAPSIDVLKLKPETLLRRKELAAALTSIGLPTALATLACQASRGGGPPFRAYGRIPLYPWGTSLEWAQKKLSPPVRTTAELDAHRATQFPQ